MDTVKPAVSPKNMCIFDAHCDTLTELKAGERSLLDAPAHFNVSKQLSYRRYLQVTDIWVDSGRHDVDARVNKNIDEFYRQLKLLNTVGAQAAEPFEVAQITDRCGLDAYFDVDGGRGKKRQAALLLAIEGGECIDADSRGPGADEGQYRFDRLHELFDRGVRLLTMTWNTPNAMCDTHLNAREPAGLTPFGRAAVAELNRLGIMIDLSHISDQGFWDVLELTRRPVVASHSDARAVCAVSRNLTDDMFRALIKNGGVTGINFCTSFLGGSKDIDRIIEHIEHFAGLGGVDHIGLGSDFDGIEELPGGIDGAESMYKIIDRLLRMGYTEGQARGIAADNFRRVFREVLPAGSEPGTAEKGVTK
ncbi:MAG: membrane dipeptidase [Clostridia bacterium]|nr:membrane dipeptidase [Clostridia bacterium]